MTKWKSEALSALGNIQTGSTPKTSIKENFGHAIPFIKPANFLSDGELDYQGEGLSEKGLAGSRLIEKDSVLMVCIGATIGKVGFNTRDVTTNQQINSFTPNGSVLTKYAYYAMLDGGFKRKVILNSGQATLPIINKTKWSKLEITYPESIEEQKRIVSILDKAFADIEQARAKTEQNLLNARELFESYLQQVFSQRGEGWRESQLKAITSKIGSGATPKGGKASYKEEGISLIRSMNVHDRRFKLKDLAFIDDAQAEKLSNVVVEENDVLLNITGASVARCCVAPSDYLPARVNQHVSIIRVDDSVLDPELLNYMLTSKFYKDQLLGIGEAGSTRQAITKTQIENFFISFPEDLNYQKKVIEGLKELESKTIKVQEIYSQKLHSFDELKKSILQKAFSGKLTNTESKGAAA